MDLLPFLEAVREIWAARDDPQQQRRQQAAVGPWLGEITIATEIYDHTDGRVLFRQPPTYTAVP